MTTVTTTREYDATGRLIRETTFTQDSPTTGSVMLDGKTLARVVAREQNRDKRQR